MSKGMAKASPRLPLRFLTIATSSGLLLWFVLAQGNDLWLPPPLQPLGHGIYRIVYWFTLPTQWLSLLLTPVAHHHVPASNAPMAAALTGIGLGLASLAARALTHTRVEPGPDKSRRVLLGTLAAGLGALAGVAAFGTAAWGVLVEPSRLQVRRYFLPVDGLPAWAEGLRIVHLSDTHYGPYVSLPYLRKAVAMANALEPDIAVLTGDYIHRTTRAIPDGVGVLCGIQARLGSFAVLGNHDHWGDPEACREVFRKGGVRMLDRQHVYLTPTGPVDAPVGEPLCLAGFGDLWEDEHPPEAALEGVDASTPRIVLSHNPDYAERLPETLRVDLMLAGHTHGGQVFVPGRGTPKIPSRYGQWYAGGLCQGPHCRVVVSRGVGMAYLPVRLGVPPELVLVTLTRASEHS